VSDAQASRIYGSRRIGLDQKVSINQSIIGLCLMQVHAKQVSGADIFVFSLLRIC